MARYNYYHLMMDEGERQELLTVLASCENSERLKSATSLYYQQDDIVTPFLKSVKAMTDALKDEEKDLGADFTRAAEMMGSALTRIRYESPRGYGYLCEEVEGLDSLLEGLGLAKQDTADNQARYYRHIAEVQNGIPGNALVGGELIKMCTGYIALHERAGNAEDWRETRMVNDGFDERTVQPLTERVWAFSEQCFGDRFYFENELLEKDGVFDKLKDTVMSEKENGATVDRAFTELYAEAFREKSEEIRARVHREGIAGDPEKATADVTMRLVATVLSEHPPFEAFEDLEKATTNAWLWCRDAAEALTQSTPPEKLRELMSRKDGGKALEEAARRSRLGKVELPADELKASTAKERIEALQASLAGTTDPERRKEYLAQIIAARQAVGAKRGGVFGGDKRLNDQLDPDKVNRAAGQAKASLAHMSAATLDRLFREAADGHGGKMLESFKQENTFAKQLEEVKAQFSAPDPQMDMAEAMVLCQLAGQPVEWNKVDKTAESMRMDPAFQSMVDDPRTVELLSKGDAGGLAKLYGEHDAALKTELPDPQPEVQKKPSGPRI